jgi:hypothetical protein
VSKYSDHTTMGGQVLAHRFRMMAQNWRIIGLWDTSAEYSLSLWNSSK